MAPLRGQPVLPGDQRVIPKRQDGWDQIKQVIPGWAIDEEILLNDFESYAVRHKWLGSKVGDLVNFPDGALRA